MPRIDLGTVYNTKNQTFFNATINSIDGENDTANITDNTNNKSYSNVPLFYHCSDSVNESGGSLEGSSSAFQVGDNVVVNKNPLRILASETLRTCKSPIVMCSAANRYFLCYNLRTKEYVDYGFSSGDVFGIKGAFNKYDLTYSEYAFFNNELLGNTTDFCKYGARKDLGESDGENKFERTLKTKLEMLTGCSDDWWYESVHTLDDRIRIAIDNETISFDHLDTSEFYEVGNLGGTASDVTDYVNTGSALWEWYPGYIHIITDAAYTKTINSDYSYIVYFDHLAAIVDIKYEYSKYKALIYTWDQVDDELCSRSQFQAYSMSESIKYTLNNIPTPLGDLDISVEKDEEDIIPLEESFFSETVPSTYPGACFDSYASWYYTPNLSQYFFDPIPYVLRCDRLKLNELGNGVWEMVGAPTSCSGFVYIIYDGECSEPTEKYMYIDDRTCNCVYVVDMSARRSSSITVKMYEGTHAFDDFQVHLVYALSFDSDGRKYKLSEVRFATEELGSEKFESIIDTFSNTEKFKEMFEGCHDTSYFEFRAGVVPTSK